MQLQRLLMHRLPISPRTSETERKLPAPRTKLFFSTTSNEIRNVSEDMNESKSDVNGLRSDVNGLRLYEMHILLTGNHGRIAKLLEDHLAPMRYHNYSAGPTDELFYPNMCPRQDFPIGYPETLIQAYQMTGELADKMLKILGQTSPETSLERKRAFWSYMGMRYEQSTGL